MTGFQIEAKMDALEIESLLSDKRVGDAVNDTLIELGRAERIHPVWPDDTVHQVAIMVEEAGEALRAALRYSYKEGGGLEEVRTELVQAGAMCLRALINLGG